MGDDRSRTGDQLLHDRRDAIGLTGEGIVALLRARRSPDAERLDHDGPIARLGETLQQVAEGIGRPEESRDQDDRLALARHRDLERLGRLHPHEEAAG